MPRPLSVPLRQEIVRRRQQGLPLTQIAADLAIPYGTVRNIWRLYRRHDREGLAPDYRSCGRPVPPPIQKLLRTACDLKREDPVWGAGLIRLQLRKHAHDRDLPSVRSLQLPFVRAGVNRPRRRRAAAVVVPQAVQPHEIWQVDAVENVPLAISQRICWLTVSDEASGAILATEVSPPPPVGTRPRARDPGDVPPRLRPLGPARPRARRQRLSLGLVPRPAPRAGVVVNRAGGRTDLESPGPATRNPKVERSNGLTQQWGELRTCTDCKQAARALNWVGRIQREEYPAIRGRTRWEVFPQLRTPRHGYRRAHEKAMWDLSRVDAFLARGCWRRHADRNGTISIYGHCRAVGRAWAQQELVVRFDASSRCWLVSNQEGEMVKQLPATELTRKRIIALAVSRRR